MIFPEKGSRGRTDGSSDGTVFDGIGASSERIFWIGFSDAVPGERKGGCLNRKAAVGIVLLMIFCVLSSLFFRLYLREQLRRYDERGAQGRQGEEGTAPLMLSGEETRESDPRESPKKRFQRELFELDRETEELLSQKGGTSLRERRQRISEIWDAKMRQIASDVSGELYGKEREDFQIEQSRFLLERAQDAKKELSEKKSGSTENIDYLKKYTELTRERCYEILDKLSD